MKPQKFIMINRIFILLAVPLAIACAVSKLFTLDLAGTLLTLLVIPLLFAPNIMEQLTPYVHGVVKKS